MSILSCTTFVNFVKQQTAKISACATGRITDWQLGAHREVFVGTQHSGAPFDDSIDMYLICIYIIMYYTCWYLDILIDWYSINTDIDINDDHDDEDDDHHSFIGLLRLIIIHYHAYYVFTESHIPNGDDFQRIRESAVDLPVSYSFIMKSLPDSFPMDISRRKWSSIASATSLGTLRDRKS